MRSAFHDSIYDRILEHFPGEIHYGAEHLNSLEMPGNIGHFLSQALLRRVELEAASLYGLTSEWFDSESEAVHVAFQGFIQTLSTAAHFPAEEWPHAVRQAVEFVSDFLIKPVPTLVHFSFGKNAEEATAENLHRRIGYFLDYPYLQTAVGAVLDRQGEARASRQDFSMTLSHIDRQMTADFESDQWIELLEPLFTMVRFARPDVAGLPVQLAHAFFEDKKRSGIAVSLRQSADASEGVLPFDALKGMIEEALSYEASLAESDPEDPEASDATEGGEPLPLWKQFTQMTPSTERTVAADEEAEVPLWKQYQQERSDENGEPRRGVAQAPAAEPEEPYTAESEEPLPAPSPEKRRITDTPTGALKGDLEFSVLGRGIDLRSRFVRVLFAGSEDEFVEVVGQLYIASDWSEASRILADNVFRRYNVDIFSDTAVAFTNAVEERFKQVT